MYSKIDILHVLIKINTIFSFKNWTKQKWYLFLNCCLFFQYSKLYWSDIYQNYIRRWQWAPSMYGILRSFNLKLTNQIKANTRAGLLLVKYYTYHIWTELSFSADLSLLASPASCQLLTLLFAYIRFRIL